MVKPCFGANEDIGVGCGDELITKVGCFVLDTLEMYRHIDDFEVCLCAVAVDGEASQLLMGDAED